MPPKKGNKGGAQQPQQPAATAGKVNEEKSGGKPSQQPNVVGGKQGGKHQHGGKK